MENGCVSVWTRRILSFVKFRINDSLEFREAFLNFDPNFHVPIFENVKTDPISSWSILLFASCIQKEWYFYKNLSPFWDRFLQLDLSEKMK